MNQDLEEYRDCVRAVLDCINYLIGQETSGLKLVRLQDLQRIFNNHLARVNGEIIASRADAVNALIGDLGQSRRDLVEAHARIVDLKDSLAKANKLVPAFNSLIQQLSAHS